MSAVPPSLTTAQLTFEDGAPVSVQFGDVYFSRAGGVEEGIHVFLEGNSLKERFAAAPHGFTIAETGFGTGLNFLLAALLWLEASPPGAALHYISIEKYPVEKAILTALYAGHPLARESEEMLAHYPLPVPGVHMRLLYDGRVRLTLLFADIAEALPVIPHASVDAWFLDGFSPAKNPDMWRNAHLQAVAARTRPGGSFATFTAAGQVKRALAAAGFDVSKCRGYGYKRDMLRGIYDPATVIPSIRSVGALVP